MGLRIGDKPLDDPSRPYVIAEASGNHGKDRGQAEMLMRAAAEAGADAVKFQTFEPHEIAADLPFPYGHDAATDAWARGLGVTRFPDLFTHGGLPRAWHASLKRWAEALGLAFLSTPFSVDAARFLVEDIGVPALKIASGDLTFTPLLEYANSTGLPVILSTGAATLDEIDAALLGPLRDTWVGERLVLLHCRSIYPCEPEDMNLRCIETLRERYNVPVGLSDHTLSIYTVPALARDLGMTVLEKHLRLAEDRLSIDVGHSVGSASFALMVQALRQDGPGIGLETAAILGDGVTAPHTLELHDRLWARRGTDGLRPTDEARAGRWA